MLLREKADKKGFKFDLAKKHLVAKGVRK